MEEFIDPCQHQISDEDSLCFGDVMCFGRVLLCYESMQGSDTMSMRRLVDHVVMHERHGVEYFEHL